MAIKAGFFGAPCYDLINYIARILAHFNKNVLMLDLSEDQSLSCSIPLPEDYDGTEYDYRGSTFSTTIPQYMGMDYEAIMIYFGVKPTEILPVDYAFCITNAELHMIAGLKDLIGQIQYDITGAPHNSKKDIRFLRNTPNILAVGTGVDLRYRFISDQLNISRRDLVCVEMDENTIRSKIACQYDTAFRFTNLSSDYKELLYRISSTLCEEELDTRAYRKAYKQAERGR